MPILTRLTRLFRADLHAVLDRIEEPELLLRQSLREMEDALADGARRLEAERGRRAAIDRRQREVEAGLSGIPDQLALCFEADNDALARVLLRRRLEGERLLAQLQQQAMLLDSTITEQQTALASQREQYERLRRETELHAPATDATPVHWSETSFAVSDADVELALLRERRRAS